MLASTRTVPCKVVCKLGSLEGLKLYVLSVEVEMCFPATINKQTSTLLVHFKEGQPIKEKKNETYCTFVEHLTHPEKDEANP